MPVTGMPYDHSRNAVCQAALDNGFTWCFFLDSDVVPPRDAILRLMSHRKPLISGVYYRRSPPEGVPVFMKDGNWYVNYPRNRLFEVDVCGAGCLLIHRTVLEKFPGQRPGAGKKWFDWRVDCGDRNLWKEGNPEALKAGPPMSEDFTFNVACKKLLGIPTVIDPSVQCYHVGLAEASQNSFRPAQVRV